MQNKKVKEISLLVDVFYQDYSWLDEATRYQVYKAGSVSESETNIKVASNYPINVFIEDLSSDDEIQLKQHKIRILEEKQVAIREKALKELQSIAEQIQDLKGIEYIPEVKL